MVNFMSVADKDLYDEFRLASVPERAPERGDSEALDEVVLNVAQDCNLACSYCFATAGTYGGVSRMMSSSVAHAAAESILSRASVSVVRFFGGEPFLNIAACETVVSDLRRGFEQGRIDALPTFTTVTNMTLWNSRIEEFLRDSDVRVTASLDGPQRLHDRLRPRKSGGGTFSVIDRHLRQMLEALGRPVAIEAVYTPSHVDHGIMPRDLHEFFVNEYGVRSVVIVPMIDSIGALSADALTTWASSLREAGRDYGVYLTADLVGEDTSGSVVVDDWIAQLLKPASDSYCHMGRGSITIDASGKISPCYTFLGHSQWECAQPTAGGDLTLPDSLRMKIERVTKSRYSSCRECDIRDACWACPGSLLDSTGVIMQVESPSCEYMIGLIEGLMEGMRKAYRGDACAVA